MGQKGLIACIYPVYVWFCVCAKLFSPSLRHAADVTHYGAYSTHVRDMQNPNINIYLFARFWVFEVGGWRGFAFSNEKNSCVGVN